MMRLVGAANGARWNNSALRSDSLEFKHEDRDNGTLAFKRWSSDGNVVLAVVNAGEGEWQNSDYAVATQGEGGTWREIFNSQATDFGGYGLGNFSRPITAGSDGMLRINLPKWSVLMFVKQ